MNRIAHLSMLIILPISFSFGQTSLSSSEIKSIQEQAITLVDYYEVALNTIADPTVSTAAKEELIYNSYAGSNRIFENENAIIESDLDPNIKDKGSGIAIEDFQVAKYFTDFNLFISKNVEEVVSFTNQTIGPVVPKKEVFVNVYFKSIINGSHTEINLPYPTINRTALVKAKQIGNNWRCYIVGVRFCESNVTITDQAVEKEYTAFTEVLYPTYTELRFKDRTEKLYLDSTQISFYDKTLTFKNTDIIIDNADAGYTFTDGMDNLSISHGDHLKIGFDKLSNNVSYMNSTKTATIDSRQVKVEFDKNKSAIVYPDRTETHFRTSVKTTYYSQPDENMILVFGGTFQMGSADDESTDNIPRQVTVGNFYIDKYEVSYRQFETFVKETGYITDAERDGWSTLYDKKGQPVRTDNITWKHNAAGQKPSLAEYDSPVVHVTWNDAVAYANWAGKRLLTEAEWEYAARGGNQSQNFPYSGSKKAADVGWYKNNSDDMLHNVGKKYKNELNLYDMTGNAAEWCMDWYSASFYADGVAVNPAGPDSGEDKVIRGGSWKDEDDDCTIAKRNYAVNGFRSGSIGFRCAMDASNQ